MAEKRRDSKGRVLRSGESQRADGQYMYRYTDANGERRTAYSWRLTETDRVPKGKKEGESLREIEQRLQHDVFDGIDTVMSENTSVNDLFDRFMSLRTELRPSTRCNYIRLYESHVRNGFGKRKIGGIRYSDVYRFYLELSNRHELSVSSIKSVNSIIRPMFELATRDGAIRSNPAAGVMEDFAKKLKEEPEKKSALTVEQQSEFLDYIYASPKYKSYRALFTTLLGTGMRIGETLGLCWKDVDFSKNTITVDHSLSYKPSEDGGYEYHVSSTKTRAGIRTIPLFSDVKTALKREKRDRKYKNGEKFVVDGYSGFVFINSAGKPYTPTFIFDVIQNIVADYNADEAKNAREAHKEPHFLPKISAHVLRHTFCTRLCENDANLKVVQDVMGHKNVRTTMNVYADATVEAKKLSFESLEGKIKLS